MSALANAWRDACTSNRSSEIFIPRGIFRVKQGKFEGLCNSPIDFQLGGTLQALKSLQGDNWITFARVDRLTLSGEGVFYGQGKAAWKRNDCHKCINCAQLPVVSNIPLAFLLNLMHLVVFERASYMSSLMF